MISPITSSRKEKRCNKKIEMSRFLSTTPRFVIDENIPAALRQSGGELTGFAKRITVYIARNAHSIQDIKDIQKESFAAAKEEGASQELYDTWCSSNGSQTYGNDILEMFGNSSNNQFIRELVEEDETALPEQEQEEIVEDGDVIEDGPISSPALQALLREGLITSQQFSEIVMFRDLLTRHRT